MPKHHPRHPHHHHSQHPEWYFNIQRYDLTPQKIGELIQNIGEKIKTDGRIRVDDNDVTFPSKNLELIIRHERTPKGELVFKVEIKWINSHDGDEPSQTGEIVIG